MRNEYINRINEHVIEHNNGTDVLVSEADTIQALVQPFILSMGYDPFNRQQVRREYKADVGLKTAEKVDFALMHSGNPAIIMEVKKVSAKLNVDNASQLYRYFNATSACIGVLTNGIKYEFYTDNNEPNVMDADPFLSIDVTKLTSYDKENLQHFEQDVFNPEDARNTASNIINQLRAMCYLKDVFNNPERPHKGLLKELGIRSTQKNVDWAEEVTAKCWRDIIGEMVTQHVSKSKPNPEKHEETTQVTISDVTDVTEVVENNELVEEEKPATMTQARNENEDVSQAISDTFEIIQSWLPDTEMSCRRGAAFYTIGLGKGKPVLYLNYGKRGKKHVWVAPTKGLPTSKVNKHKRRTFTDVQDINNYKEEILSRVNTIL